MGGRDPHEAHRTATPLELLFDLTFATSFAFAASQFAHALAEGHYTTALLGFALASFGICWAWINFSWFSSAYAIGAATSGVGMTVCLIIVMFAPVVTVVGYEMRGYRHQAESLMA
jgi:low temperature requirement protein LtrA